MKKFYFVLITILTIVISVFVMSCNRGNKKVQVGAAVYGLKGEFMRLWTTALERHPAVVAGEVDITVFDGNYDASVQYSQFETMVSQGYDAILFVPIDIEAGVAAVELAVEADIPVVGSNTRVNTDKLYSYIGSDDVISGAMEAQSVVDGMGGKGNLVIIEGPIGQSAQIQRREGNLKVLQKYPDIQVLEMKTANWSRAESLSLMEDWLNSHPGQINGVIGQNDEMALGAIQAIKQAGLNIKDFAIAGIDGVTDAMYAVKDNEMNSILQDAVGQAQGALDLALRAVLGDDYAPKADVWNDLDWENGTQKLYNVPWVPITLQNVDTLLTTRQALTNK